MRTTSWILGFVLCAACGSGTSQTETETATETETEQPPPDTTGSDRPSMTVEECEQQGGTVVGDIGDGAVHRPDYVCPSGQPPIGQIPLGVEGSVCCPS